MNTELTGPVEIGGKADFPTKGLWNVHGIFTTEALYANGVKMIVSNELPNGIKFEGTDGWIFVTRGAYRATPTDPIPDTNGVKSLEASDPKIITSIIGANEIHLTESSDHHGNWLESVKSRKQPIAPVEVAHRACSACLLHHIAMKLKRKVYWNPDKEEFTNDAEANAMISREMRAPYKL
jgi:Oxidoreductase family, C-terminal alpha/beta domain